MFYALYFLNLSLPCEPLIAAEGYRRGGAPPAGMPQRHRVSPNWVISKEETISYPKSVEWSPDLYLFISYICLKLSERTVMFLTRRWKS